MKRGSRRRLGFLGFALVTVWCGAPTLADETHDPFWMVASSTPSDAILPGVALSRDDREGLCRLPDADNRPADSDCGGHVAGEQTATLSGEVAREVVRQAHW